MMLEGGGLNAIDAEIGIGIGIAPPAIQGNGRNRCCCWRVACGDGGVWVCSCSIVRAAELGWHPSPSTHSAHTARWRVGPHLQLLAYRRQVHACHSARMYRDAARDDRWIAYVSSSFLSSGLSSCRAVVSVSLWEKREVAREVAGQCKFACGSRWWDVCLLHVPAHATASEGAAMPKHDEASALLGLSRCTCRDKLRKVMIHVQFGGVAGGTACADEGITGSLGAGEERSPPPSSPPPLAESCLVSTLSDGRWGLPR